MDLHGILPENYFFVYFDLAFGWWFAVTYFSLFISRLLKGLDKASLKPWTAVKLQALIVIDTFLF